jgi:hypothetical protein
MPFLSAHLRSDISLAESRLQSTAKARLYAERGTQAEQFDSEFLHAQAPEFLAEIGVCFDGRKNLFQHFEHASSEVRRVCAGSEIFRWAVGVGITGGLGYVRRVKRQYGVCGYTVVLDDPQGRGNSLDFFCMVR